MFHALAVLEIPWISPWSVHVHAANKHVTTAAQSLRPVSHPRLSARGRCGVTWSCSAHWRTASRRHARTTQRMQSSRVRTLHSCREKKTQIKVKECQGHLTVITRSSQGHTQVLNQNNVRTVPFIAIILTELSPSKFLPRPDWAQALPVPNFRFTSGLTEAMDNGSFALLCHFGPREK